MLGVLEIVADDVAGPIAEPEDAGFQSVGGDGAGDLLHLLKVAAFIVSEEEGLVFPERAAPTSAVALVVDVGLGDLSCVVVPGIGVEDGILKEAVAGTVHAVRSVASHQRHLAAGCAGEIGVGIGHGDAEFLHRILRGGHGGAGGRDDGGDVDAIERDGVLIVYGSGDPGSEAAAGGDHARLQVHQLGDVALEGWQAGDEILRNRVADLRVGGLQLGFGRGGYFDDLVVASDFQLEVVFRRFVDFDGDVRDGGSAEARHFHRDFVRPGTDAAEQVLAGAVGGLGLDGVGILADQFHLGLRDDGVGWIGDSAGDGAGGGRLRGRVRRKQHRRAKEKNRERTNASKYLHEVNSFNFTFAGERLWTVRPKGVGARSKTAADDADPIFRSP